MTSRRLSRPDWALLAGALCAIAGSCLLASPRRALWADEVFSWMLLKDASFRHMWATFLEGADGGGSPLYFLAAWPWKRVFGVSALSLRAFSAAGFGAAVLALWRTLRRCCGTRATAFGVLAAFFTWQPLLYQLAEARFYGLFTAMAALAVGDFAEHVSTPRRSLRSLLASAFIHAGLVSSHYLGIGYSGLVLLASVAWDGAHRRWRPRAYAPLLLGWTSLLLWVRPLQKLRDLTHPRGWIPVPSLDDLTRAIPWHLALLLAGIAVLAALTSRRRGAPPEGDEASLRRALALLGACLLVAPLAVFLFSRAVQPLFVTRYFIPVSVGWALLLAVGAEAFAGAPLTGWRSAPWLVVLALALAYPLAYARYGESREDFAPAVERLAAGRGPIVVDDYRAFLPLAYAARAADTRFVFPLDEAVAFAPDALYDAPLIFKQARRQRELGLLPAQWVDGAGVLCTAPELTVVHFPPQTWFDARVSRNPDLDRALLGDAGGATVWRVQWRAGVKPASCP